MDIKMKEQQVYNTTREQQENDKRYSKRYSKFIRYIILILSINTKNIKNSHELKIHVCSLSLMQIRRRMLTPIDHGFENNGPGAGKKEE